MAKIIILHDGQVERQVPLSKERISLGRHSQNDIVLAHPTVSGRHAAIVTILDDSFLEDLHSTNGTYVNGHRIGKHFLQDKDIIRLAKVEMEFRADGVRPSAAAATAAMAALATHALADIEILNGNNAGKRMALTKPLTSLGRPGAQVVAIHRTPAAYRIEQREGALPVLLNGVALDGADTLLRHGDVIELDGTLLAFRLA